MRLRNASVGQRCQRQDRKIICSFMIHLFNTRTGITRGHDCPRSVLARGGHTTGVKSESDEKTAMPLVERNGGRNMSEGAGGNLRVIRSAD